jgi:hypothetical protein
MVRHVERKAMQIHSLYIVVIKGTTNLSTAYALVDSLYCGKWEIPSVVYIVSRESIFRLPGIIQ